MTEKEVIEEWKTIKLFPNYAVSNTGKIKSLARMRGGNGSEYYTPDKMLSASLVGKKRNYFAVILTFSLPPNSTTFI